MARFQILGSCIPPMLTRTEDFDRIWRALTKPTPDNLTVVGPRYIGKTVLLNHLATRVKAGGTKFKFVMYWHLGHDSPKTNEEFFKQFSGKLLESLAEDLVTREECEESLTSGGFDSLRDVMDYLSDTQRPALILWDMLDAPLSQPGISAELWGQIRSLFYGKGHRIVTTSRKPPSELVRDVATEGSPFWNIFDPSPIRLVPFSEAEQEAILDSCLPIGFEKGARTEIQNYTGGVPILFLSMVNQLLDTVREGKVSVEMVRGAEEPTFAAVGSNLKEIWRGCSSEAKHVYHEITESGTGIGVSKVAREDRDTLVGNGFASVRNNKLVPGCRLLQARVREGAADALALSRLFKEPVAFDNNIKGLLELRLLLIPESMRWIKKDLKDGISELSEGPERCLHKVRSVLDACLDLIWEKELGKPPVIPSDWLSEWANAGERGAEQKWSGQIPDSRGHQVRLLQLMTGTQNSPPRAKWVSKTTYALIAAAHVFGDLGWHRCGSTVPTGVAATAFNICIELATRLNEELSQPAK